MTVSDTPWNSLEIAKLVANFAIPAVLLMLGILVSRIEKKFEQRLDQREFSRSWKKDIYDEIAPDLNLLFCTFNYVGPWREYNPESIIDAKRRIEEKIFAYSPIFTAATMKKFNDLMAGAFETGRGRGTTLLIRSNFDMFAESSAVWKEEYQEMFVKESKRITRKEFNALYDDFREALFKDLGFLS
ncbi:hypothetical protein [uncultured Roseobacter sp.]|uniref:hypothetical protein n=1 Tax=uncultured Roseobacter sp. TaxID=114847 RepID=UPI00260A5A8F|nr:hypothetical protein [uncultured Roseobacter sp.]